jgi:hypothetical protein
VSRPQAELDTTTPSSENACAPTAATLDELRAELAATQATNCCDTSDDKNSERSGERVARPPVTTVQLAGVDAEAKLSLLSLLVTTDIQHLPRG